MPAEQFGIIMSQILLMKDDEWKDTLIKTGGALGRFIYILDAYEDLEEDNKRADIMDSGRIHKDLIMMPLLKIY